MAWTLHHAHRSRTYGVQQNKRQIITKKKSVAMFGFFFFLFFSRSGKEGLGERTDTYRGDALYKHTLTASALLVTVR